jgi:hypothetical protein
VIARKLALVIAIAISGLVMIRDSQRQVQEVHFASVIDYMKLERNLSANRGSLLPPCQADVRRSSPRD